MEEAMLELETEEKGPSHYLAVGIVVSLILHLVGGAALLALPQGASPAPAVSYLDLRMMTSPASTPAPTMAPITAPDRTVRPKPSEFPPPKPAAPEPATPKPAEPEPPLTQAQQAPTFPAPPAAQSEPEPILPRSTLGLGLTKGYFKSLGDGATLKDGIREYYLGMLQGINEKWWLDRKDKGQVAPIIISIVIARDGRIVDNQVLRSSGDPRYDRAVQSALASAGPLPPLPASYEGDFFQAPIRLVPPLNLMLR